MLVTVVGSRRADVTLAPDIPMAELLPQLVALCGAPAGGASSLAMAGGQPFGPHTTLGDNGVLDGTVLYLTDGAVPSPAPAAAALPRLPDPARVLPRRRSWAARVAPALSAMTRRVAPPERPAAGVGPASPRALTVERVPPPLERARLSWRSTDYEALLDDQLAAPRLARCATVAVVSPKGGVGKTTLAALVGTLLALVRRDRIVAVDTNPDYGSLGRVLVPEHPLFVDDLIGVLDSPGVSVTTLDAKLGRGPHGLMVLPAPVDPGRMAALDEAAYRQVVQRLQTLVGVVLLDCGTGLQEPPAHAALREADQIMLVTDGEPATASLVAEAMPLLARTGRPVVLAVNRMPRTGRRLDLAALAARVPEAHAIVVIPDEPSAAARLATGDFDWSTAPASWRVAVRELAAMLVAQWPALGLVAAPAARAG